MARTRTRVGSTRDRDKVLGFVRSLIHVYIVVSGDGVLHLYIIDHHFDGLGTT